VWSVHTQVSNSTRLKTTATSQLPLEGCWNYSQALTKKKTLNSLNNIFPVALYVQQKLKESWNENRTQCAAEVRSFYVCSFQLRAGKTQLERWTLKGSVCNINHNSAIVQITREHTKTTRGKKHCIGRQNEINKVLTNYKFTCRCITDCCCRHRCSLSNGCCHSCNIGSQRQKTFESMVAWWNRVNFL
jgi:hypothetical protein